MITVTVEYEGKQFSVDMDGPVSEPIINWDLLFVMDYDSILHEYFDVSARYQFSDNKRFAPIKEKLMEKYRAMREGANQNREYDNGEGI